MLSGDRLFIEAIRKSQSVLLEAMSPSRLERAWREGFSRIRTELDISRRESAARELRSPTKRIAVIVPVGYRGGSLRGAKLLSYALHCGSVQCGEAAEITLLHLDEDDVYADDDFADLHPDVKRRTFRWKTLDWAEARRAMRYAGHTQWEPSHDGYVVVDDGIKQLLDFDLWLVISDRLRHPLLPMRPVIHMVYDYIQRYVPFMEEAEVRGLSAVARSARQVWVTTDFTKKDAIQYAGVHRDKVIKLPMLAPDFGGDAAISESDTPASWFIWTTNSAPHKNHFNALRALRIYYEELDGKLECCIVGVNSKRIFSHPPDELKKTIAAIKGSAKMRRMLIWRGELSDFEYRKALCSAAFLWHAGQIDNGTFSVVEAASVGVPALSSDYPAMREIDGQFSLSLAWMDPFDARSMAVALKDMESQHVVRRSRLPGREVLNAQSVERLAGYYWKTLREVV